MSPFLLALAATGVLVLVLLVAVPLSPRYGEGMVPGPLRSLRSVAITAALALWAAPEVARRLRAAGRDDSPRGVRWVRRRCLVVCGLTLAMGVVAAWALDCPLWLVPAVSVASGAVGLAAPILGLQREVGQRSLKLRYELVELLRAMAGMVAAGLSITYSLEVVARHRGALHAELADALRQREGGISDEEALALFAQRCATEDVTDAVRTLLGALEGRRTENAPLLRNLARGVEARLRQEAEVRRAQGLLKTQLVFGALGLPPFLMAIAYPLVMMVLQAM